LGDAGIGDLAGDLARGVSLLARSGGCLLDLACRGIGRPGEVLCLPVLVL
jgi:hypothetical protein